MVFIGQAVGVDEIGVRGTDGLRFPVHHVDEAFHASADALRDQHGRIIGGIDQHDMKCLIQRHGVAFLQTAQLCACFRYVDTGGCCQNGVGRRIFQGNQRGHDLGQRRGIKLGKCAFGTDDIPAADIKKADRGDIADLSCRFRGDIPVHDSQAGCKSIRNSGITRFGNHEIIVAVCHITFK